MFEDIKKSAGTVMAENFSLPMTILERGCESNGMVNSTDGDDQGSGECVGDGYNDESDHAC